MKILLLSFLCMGTLGAAVVENAPGYNAWPMIQAVDGKLICTYSRGSGHSIGEGRRDAFARVSADGGQTWGDEVAVSANPDEGEVMIGKGLDSSGAALFWVRCLGKAKHHDLYRTTDGVTFEKIASPTFEPFPMQVTDIVKVKRGLLCLWFQTNYKKDGKSSWGTLESSDDGRTWTQKSIEKDLDLPELPTEPSFVNLGDGRLLGIARTEIAGEKGGRQFQLTSTDEGLTWQKAKTNIGDIRISTPSLVYDRATGLVHNYYYERGKGKVKRRIVQADAIFARPTEWPEPTVVATGREERPHDAGNVNVTVVGTTHYLAYYYGTQTDAAVYVEPVSLPAVEKFQQNVVPAVHQVRRATETFGADPARASRRVAFVGNSITRHGPKPSIGWTNDCGMAASSVDKDYVHVCAAELERDVPGGTYRLVNVAGSLERSFMKPEWSPEKDFAGLKDFKPDVVVFFFGANVPKTYDADPSTAARNFGAAVEALARYLDTGHTQFLISEGFYIRPALDAEKKAAAERLGATFVKMDDIRRRDDAHGRFNHPSDTGMRLIAERFASVIRQVSSAPSCANLLAETRRVGSERPKIAVFGGSFSCIKPSEVAKRAWSEALDCDVENFGMGGMGFLRGAEKTNDIPNQIRKALATRNRYAAFVLWASTNDLRYPVEEQNASISNCVRLIREGSPESKVLFFASMPWPLNPDNDAKLARLVDGQLETCRQLNVPCLDLYHDSGITAENAVHYTAADKHHPNAAGYAKVAPLQVGFLEMHLPSLSWSYRFDDGSFAPIDLQAQIDAVAAQGGGRVDVPKGRWLTDPIELKSRVELHLSAGCELFFTDELEKCLPAVRTTYEGIECLNYRPLISAYGATQIAITGRGKIEPQMGRWETWRWNGLGTQQAKATLNEWGNRDVPVAERDLTKLPGAKTRPPFVEFNGCTDIRLEGFVLRNSPFWCIHLLNCDRASVRGLSVSAFMNNSDGIDIECSRNVTVEDCSFDQGDDVIVLKSGKDRDGRRRATPTENVTIRRCRAGSGHGFLVAGSECSGGIRNVTMEDCLVDGSLATLFKVKTSPTRGGFVENLTMRRVTARTILDAVVDVKANYALNASAGDAEEVLTEIRGLTLEDISVGTANIRCDIQGDARRPVQDVRLANVTVGRCARADKIVHADVGTLGAAVVENVPAYDAGSVIQARIDAVSVAGGGRVVVPAGRHLVGQIDLKSNVELHLEKGAVLEGKVGLANYRVTELPYSEGTWSAIISAIGVTNVAVTGEGEIFGNGTAWPQPEDYGGNQEGRRPRGLFFADCKGVRLADFKLRDAACWGVVLKCCEDVDIRWLAIDNHANANNDGIDVEAKNVVIADCDIDAGDDAVCLKSNTPDFVVENVLVTNVTARSHCNGLKLGTASHGTMRNILFVDCRTEAPRRDFIDRRFGRNRRWYEEDPGRVKHYPGGVHGEAAGSSSIVVENVDGGTVEDITYRNISVHGSRAPIFVRAGTRTGRSCGTPPSDKYVFRNITIENVTGEAMSAVASSVTGVPGCRITNVTLRNVNIVTRGGGENEAERTRPVPEVAGKYPDAHMFGCMLPAYGLYGRHVDGLKLENVSFTLAPGMSDCREMMVFDDVIRMPVAY